MDEVDAVDELGPVDWIVVEFPGAGSTGRLCPRCCRRDDRGGRRDDRRDRRR